MTERAASLGRRMFLLVAVWAVLCGSLALAQNTAPASVTAAPAEPAAATLFTARLFAQTSNTFFMGLL